MRSSRLRFDKPFLILSIILVLVGFGIFMSASMGLLARGTGPRIGSVAFNHITFGVVGGLIAMAITSRIHYRVWRKFALPLFITTLVITCLVFVPGIGFAHGGAHRWIHIGSFTFQPTELLKIGYLVYLAAWFSGMKDKISEMRYGIIPMMVISGITGAVMLAQPDTDTFAVMVLAAITMYFAAGGKFRHIATVGIIGIALIAVLAFQRPYLMSRFKVFLNPANDPRGSGYQVQQSLIAIGSGQVFGRGFGQSIQKFNFLPEPVSDSIFAVAAEEFGFVGAVMLVLLMFVFALRGFRIATRAPDTFGGLLIVGIVILIITQSFLNIGSMLGIMPLSGLPLIFVSQGGTALLFALASVGIILNISRYQKS
jgi:cell division protein FtsW